MSSDHHPEEDPLLLVLPTAAAGETRSKRSYDDVVESCIGSFGWAQCLQVLLASFAWFFDAQQSFITIFTDLVPSWHCNTTLSSQCHKNMNASEFCALPRGTWAWDTPSHSSIVSEWSLECAGPFVTGLPSSSFFTGSLVGGILLSALADSTLGRKKMLAVCCLLMNVTSIVTSTASNVWIYSFLRFVSGFCRATIGTCAIVLPTEIVGRRWRGQVGIVGFLCFYLGYLSLPLIAYFNSGFSWRYLYLLTGVPGLIHSILVFFFLYESPRWLYIRGHTADFVQTIRNIAPPETRNSITSSFFSSFISQENQDQVNQSMDLYSALKVLLYTGWAVRRLLAVVCAAFGYGLVYYGIPLCAGELPFSIYLSTALNAISELPAAFLISLVIGKLSKRNSVLGLSVMCGTCCVGCAVLVVDRLKVVQIGLEVGAFFGGCTGFCVLLLYTLDLFPTCVRSSAVAMVRQGLMLGGTVSPLLVGLGRSSRYYSYGLFGLAVGVCCLFVLTLPETFGRKVCDTMEEEDSLQEI